MKCTLISCGPPANDSEKRCFEALRNGIGSETGDGEWILLANYSLSISDQRQSDEIDLIAIGPPGVRVIEIKHWSDAWARTNVQTVEREADKLTMKARRVGTTIRNKTPDSPYVEGRLILTQDRSSIKKLSNQEVRGVRFHGLNDWKGAINFGGPPILDSAQVELLAHLLYPKSTVAIAGSMRRLGDYVNLELQTPPEQSFHRIYRGTHPDSREKILLHLYDLSNNGEQNAEVKAKREYDSLRRLESFHWAPRIFDRYREAPGYEGDMYFFTIVDPAAPSIAERAKDDSWSTANRLTFARDAVRALKELHGARTEPDLDEGPMIHRNLSPRTILVRHDGSPILTGFESTRLPSEFSIGSVTPASGDQEGHIPPEILKEGSAAADIRSDTYSMASSLQGVFEGRQDDDSQESLNVLASHADPDPRKRGSLQDLENALTGLLGESIPYPTPPKVEYWTEDQVLRFGNFDYRIETRLGSGGIGTAFKVAQIEPGTKNESGVYVAKVIHKQTEGETVLRSYRLARPYLQHQNLTGLLELDSTWHEDSITALLNWVPGMPLSDLFGVLPIHAEDEIGGSVETLAIRWIRDISDALGVLHRNGLVHGDVSPGNLIVSESRIVLTDYDFVGKIGESPVGPGSVRYASPKNDGHLAKASDDIYALAASFFEVIFDRSPFDHEGVFDKQMGLNWNESERSQFPTLSPMLERATHPDQNLRFQSINEVLAVLVEGATTTVKAPPSEQEVEIVRSERSVDWLLPLLYSYPGSRFGNEETRGLDTEFAESTFVETNLEKTLFKDIRARNISLVILCGNAGDGKTALLQHLAEKLGLGKRLSIDRILEGRDSNGTYIKMNLDGSASWVDQSADDLLDDLLEPFKDGPPSGQIVHLLAINDGRLMEWISRVEGENNGKGTKLTEALYDYLMGSDSSEKHIRFLSLNQNSLVGGVSGDSSKLDTRFLDTLIDKLYGGERTAEHWDPCRSCTAMERCQVYRTSSVFAPDLHPAMEDTSRRDRARERLYEALQAVHMSGEVHITIRELRAALVYILFGVHHCSEYHHGDILSGPSDYWDLAFDSRSPQRQGELLEGLLRFDPGLESNPKLDRHVLKRYTKELAMPGDGSSVSGFKSARRRAFFEWSEDDAAVSGEAQDPSLARGRHLTRFRDLAFGVDNDQVCKDLCRGISRLEDLPPQVLEVDAVVPIRVTPNTPTETHFWVQKRQADFDVRPSISAHEDGMEHLHRQVDLVYRYREGQEELLHMGAELFHFLLELSEGYQLGDLSTDDTFSNLSIFVRRLRQEKEDELYAWNPVEESCIYKISTTNMGEGADGPRLLSIEGETL